MSREYLVDAWRCWWRDFRYPAPGVSRWSAFRALPRNLWDALRESEEPQT